MVCVVRQDGSEREVMIALMNKYIAKVNEGKQLRILSAVFGTAKG